MSQPADPPAPEAPEPGAAPPEGQGPRPTEQAGAIKGMPEAIRAHDDGAGDSPEISREEPAVPERGSDQVLPAAPVDQATGTPDEQPCDGDGQPAPAGRGLSLTEQAGIFTGVLGVLLSVGFVFLPVGTLAEKTYVLFACLALSAASVTGIGAWRSGRRFGLTAASVCIAVVCLVMNNIVSSQPPKPRPTFALAGTVTIEQSSSDQGSGTPLITVTPQGCQGAGGYADLSAGTAVVVTDSQGRQVAVGAMQTGKVPGGHRNWCVLPFSVQGVPRGLPTYSVTVSHRGTQVYSPEEAQAGVALEIGP